MPISQLSPEYPTTDGLPHSAPLTETEKTSIHHPIPFQPYPAYTSAEYTAKYHPTQECFIDEAKTVHAPHIFSYPGVPQYMSDPLMGSYDLLGIRDDVCFDRVGRYGPYGLKMPPVDALNENLKKERKGIEYTKVLMGGEVDWRDMDWRRAQDNCYEDNKERFRREAVYATPKHSALQKLSRTAVVLRTYVGFEYTPHVVIMLRAMINELSLQSRGEYSVHLLVNVKNDSAPIWVSPAAYDAVLEEAVPPEFRGIATLWSEAQMQFIYPNPFPNNVENMSGGNIHGVYRSPHFALQYFAQQHPEYDFFWNWEMDMRYTGHFYELFDRIGGFAKEQPRKGLWERSAKHYIPALHGSWADFSALVEREHAEGHDAPVYGPQVFDGTGYDGLTKDLKIPSIPKCAYSSDPASQRSCGVNEEADLITLNPLFNPNNSGWFFENDITGYPLGEDIPLPPRRTAIVTASRLSKRLLDIMHTETWQLRHSMFAEMFPPSIALHHGLKAVYAPHPVFFDRAWPLEKLDATLNGAEFGSSGGNQHSVFGHHEHNFQGSSWYYNSGFAGALWRRWLGWAENGEGGREEEEVGSGRMCLRSTLVHPIKYEHMK